MRVGIILGCAAALCLGSLAARAQQTNQTDSLEKRLQQLQETFEKQQREMRESFERMLREQQVQIEALKRQIAVTQTNALAGSPSTNAVTPEQVKALNQKVDQVLEAQKKELLSEFNPAIGLVSETIFSYRSQGNENTGSSRIGGFDVFQRSVELALAASVDPFAQGYAVINGSADAATGEANLGVEEAAVQTTSLPWNLQLKAGRFFAEFGKLSYIHDHELPFVNRPLVLDQYIGGESRTDGAQLNWLLPLPHYVSLTTGLGVGFGGDSPINDVGTFRPLSGLNYYGRLSTYFDLTPDLQFETGLSGLINPSTDDRGGALVQPAGGTLTEKERRVGGLDFRLSYVPLQNNQFRRVDWGTEILYSDSRFLFAPNGPSGSPGEFTGDVGSLGLYSYVTYKWHRQWSAGFLFDYVQSPENHEAQTYAFSPYLTWALSHWNQIRLQYTHTEPNTQTGLRPDDAVYLQWAWIIGSHSHGWQAR